VSHRSPAEPLSRRSLTWSPQSQLAYSVAYSDNLTTLASGYADAGNGVIQGLLYVPDLPGDGPCSALELAYVPKAAVRQVNLPPTNYNLIALAPWFNASCSRSYLLSARLDPIKAFIFYQPVKSSDTPPPDDAIWNIDDGTAWKTQNHFPTFAVPGRVGAEMMTQLSRYSGNISSVPFGENISALYNPDASDYIRIWTQLTVSTPSGLPNIWVFILAVIGVLLLVISTTCCGMHLTWRRRRRSLRRRVVAGEVNLEAQGIKRLTVPLAHIEKFPLFTYNYEPDAARSPPTSPASSKPSRRGRPRRSSRARADSTPSSAPLPDAPGGPSDLEYQPACHICLDAFTHRATVIRELPCGHIYHPDCIDEFLSRVSSLCPRCRTAMLPPGYCPPVSNSMVRRELATRRLRGRVEAEDDDDDGFSARHGRIHSWGSSVKKRLFSAAHTVEPGQTPPPQQQSPTPGIELRTRSRGEAGGAENPDEDAETARQRRMRELAGPDIESDDGHAPVCTSSLSSSPPCLCLYSQDSWETVADILGCREESITQHLSRVPMTGVT